MAHIDDSLLIYFESSKISVSTNGKTQTNGTNGDIIGDGDKLNGRRKFSKRDEELIRLIGQHLLSVGLENSARTLVKESDTTFENTSASLFRQSILDGDWENAFTALEQLQYEIKKKNKGMCFIQQLVSIKNSVQKFRANRVSSLEIFKMDF